MRCERFAICTLVLLLAACSRETPAPPSPATAAPTPVVTSTSLQPAQTQHGSYDAAMTWLRTAPSFQFAIDESGMHAEGTMKRRTVGAESIEVRSGSEEWRAASGPNGVAWEKRSGAKWVKADAPAWGPHLYQRVTLVFDPQKKEGAAQADGSDPTSAKYRFTNANTGEVHEVWVDPKDDHVQRIRIGDAFDMRITVTPGA